jgi:hypothetical protein
MDVLGPGFGRTGTLSLKIALEQLGFGPCLHMITLLDEAERAGLFLRAADGDAGSLAKAMEGHRSAVDWPLTYVWRQAIEQFPAAKVILTVRDPARWYESARRTIFWAAQNAPPPGEEAEPATVAGLRLLDRTVWSGTFGGRFDDRENAIAAFEAHNAAVRAEVPADRLLVFEVTEGWQPLCDFLGVPVPAGPFPRANDAASFRARVDAAHGEGRL